MFKCPNDFGGMWHENLWTIFFKMYSNGAERKRERGREQALASTPSNSQQTRAHENYLLKVNELIVYDALAWNLTKSRHSAFGVSYFFFFFKWICLFWFNLPIRQNVLRLLNTGLYWNNLNINKAKLVRGRYLLVTWFDCLLFVLCNSLNFQIETYL